MASNNIFTALRWLVRKLGLSARLTSAGRHDLLSAHSVDRSEVSPGDNKPKQEYNARLAVELATFENNDIVHDLPQIFHYWSNTYLRPKIEAFGFSHPDDFFIKNMTGCIKDTATQYRFVSIGAGNCDTEVRIANALVLAGHTNFTIECVEINPAMLKRGRELAAIKSLTPYVLPVHGDFNAWQPQHEYHGVIANQSLHHVTNLEQLFDAVCVAIKPTNGIFVTSDMIGRNGHQRWPEALVLVEEFWRQLAPRYHFNHQLQRQEDDFVNWNCAADGFEGIRAQDILPLLVQRFHFDMFVPFGNIVSPFIDRSFGPNFDAASEIDKSFIDAVHAADEAHITSGHIKPTQMFAVMSLDYAREMRHLAGLAPEFCVRQPDELT